MPVTVQGSGSQACTVTTEHTLLDIAVAGAFELNVDKTPFADGDTFELRCYKIFKAGGTRRVVDIQVYNGVQPADDMGAVFVPRANALTDAGSLRYTIKQTFGTGRTVDWEVLKLS